MTKPSDFFLGVVEFFAVLLPGAAFVYLLRPNLVGNMPQAWLPATPTQEWMIFLVMAYITGHLLHGLGSALLDDYVYGKLYLPIAKPAHVQAAKLINAPAVLQKDEDAAKTLLARVRLQTAVDATGTSYYDWCLSDIRMKSPASAAEVDRIQADSKFFRSMVFVFLSAAFVSLDEGTVWVTLGAPALTVFAVLRFCELRWSATKRVYEYYLLLHPPAGGCESA